MTQNQAIMTINEAINHPSNSAYVSRIKEALANFGTKVNTNPALVDPGGLGRLWLEWSRLEMFKDLVSVDIQLA